MNESRENPEHYESKASLFSEIAEAFAEAEFTFACLALEARQAAQWLLIEREETDAERRADAKRLPRQQ